MFIVRPLSTPAPQVVTGTYSVLSGSDVVIEATGNAAGKLKLKYNFSFAVPAAASGSVMCKLQYSLQPSGLTADWQTVSTATRPLKITANQPFRADLDIPHTLSSGIPAGYELQYRMMVALGAGSDPVTVHDSSISASAHIDVAQGESNIGVIKIYALAAVGVAAEAWGGVAVLMKADAAVGISAEAWGGVATLTNADAAVGVSAEVFTDYTDPIRIKPPQVTEPVVQALEADWEAVSGTTILIEERAAGWLPHYAALSFHIPCKATGASGGEAEFKVARSIDDGAWADIALAVGSWSAVIEEEQEGLAVLEWTIDQTAGIPANTSVRYRLYGKFVGAGYDVEVNSTGKPGVTYKPDFEV